MHRVRTQVVCDVTCFVGRLSRYTDQPSDHIGYYELIAETGFFTPRKEKKSRQFFDKSVKLVQEDVIIGVTYRSGK